MVMAERVPFFHEDLLFGSGEGVALCTLWTPKSKYSDLLDYFYIIGNLYSKYGLCILVRNVLATPSIQKVIFTGIDHPEKKRRFVDIFLDKNISAEELFIEDKYLDYFYEKVDLVDRRDIPLSAREELISYKKSEFYEREKIFIELPSLEIKDSFPSQKSTFVFRDTDVMTMHHNILNEIMMFGHNTELDKEGHYRRELWNVVAVIPYDSLLNGRFPLYDQSEIQSYGNSLWEGDEPEELTYKYGYTMRFQYGDQIGKVIDILKSKRESFRSVISLWDPSKSLYLDDQPCLITVQFRIFEGIDTILMTL